MRNLLVFRKTRLEREQYDESIGRCALRGRIRQMAMRDIVIGTTAAASSSKPPPFLDPLPPKARLQRGSGAHSFKYKQIHNHSSRSHLQHTWDGSETGQLVGTGRKLGRLFELTSLHVASSNLIP
ncbi:uncharacterized protein LOC103715912 isoform X4 [Phoenix dactylifera]|uniref:Uncharacterized protein LOC103715912 isoform X4 n=1 Tax=Phoenix dactylifera TaxID=42345 RepID=A0A8B9A8Z8_PHODC|nr:uncharacterized protein LOC103715912 isoform X4 [Phoenix dactylifera]